VIDIVDLGRTVEVVVELASGVELRARTIELPEFGLDAACWVSAAAEAISVWPRAASAIGDRATAL
jgi:hypothetical protein